MKLFRPGRGWQGAISLGGDKSISHRLLLFALQHHGRFIIENISQCDDVKTSLKIFEQAGGRIETLPDKRLCLESPAEISDLRRSEIFCGNSGTTARLLCGILAGLPFSFRLTGDESLSRRPMRRVIEPLEKMGAGFSCNDGRLPLTITGSAKLDPISHNLQVASAQVKSAILLAATRAEGLTTIEEPLQSRNHSEILLRELGAEITADAGRITLRGPFNSAGDFSFKVPGDTSSAAFIVAAATLLPGSKIEINNVLLNPQRIAFLHKLKQMGAQLNWKVESSEFEESGTIHAGFSPDLKAVNIEGHEVPGLIDELPVLAAVMAFAIGTSSVRGAAQLRIKESDRISSICRLLKQIGVAVEELEDGYCITGPAKITKRHTVEPAGDHRIAATMAVMALASEQGMLIANHQCVKISFPEFSDFFQTFSPETFFEAKNDLCW